MTGRRDDDARHDACDGATPAWRVTSVHAVRFAAADQTVSTLEGPVTADAGDAIVTGVLGEEWPVPLAEFRRTYSPAGRTSFGQPGAYLRRRERVVAAPVAAAPRRRVAGGMLTGEPGDFLVRDRQGRERIVARNVFARTYVWDPPARTGPACETARYARFERDLHRDGRSEAVLAGLGRIGGVIDRIFRRCLGANPATWLGGTAHRDRRNRLAARYAELADGAAIAAAGAGALAITLALVPLAAGLRPATAAWPALAIFGAATLAALAVLDRHLPDWRMRASDYRTLADSSLFPTSEPQAIEPGGPWWQVVSQANAAEAAEAAYAAGTAGGPGGTPDHPADIPPRLQAVRDRCQYYGTLAATSAAIVRNGQAAATLLTAVAAVGFVLAAVSHRPGLLPLAAVPAAWAGALRVAIAALEVERRRDAAGSAAAGLGRVLGELDAALPAGSAADARVADAFDQAGLIIRTASLQRCGAPATAPAERMRSDH
ncbi:MAG: PGDYG domain-containing protein [Lautropia sp.]